MGARALLLGGILAVSCGAQQNPTQLLTQIRNKVAASVSRLPRYLCTETVDRKNLEVDPWAHGPKVGSCAEIREAAKKPKLHLFSSDRLRLDVAIASDGEMYSWVGEGQFEDQSLGDLVKQGAVSSGAFGSFLQAVFVSDVASFAFKGERELNGKRVLEYTFAVPLWRSGYQVGNRTLHRLTGYKGSFTADAATLDLLRLELETDPLPAELEICDAVTTLDYTQVRMNNADFLLPSTAYMQIVNSDGSESENRTEFTGCHQFLGESKLIFDEPSEGSAAQASAAEKPRRLTAGLAVSVALTEPIDPAKAAAGDAVTGRLAKTLKDPTAGAILPKGTKLTGRIFELRYFYGMATSLEFAVKWEHIDIGAAHCPIELAMKPGVPGTAKAKVIQSRNGGNSQFEDRSVGVFVFSDVGKNYHIPAGFEAEWATLPSAFCSF